MQMQFYTADYVLGAVTLVAAILGMFGGFSGALGFCAGVAAAGAAGKFGYGYVAAYCSTQWMSALATLVISLVAFGVARAIVRRIVKGLLAQPADAIFGFLVAAVTGAAVSLTAVFAANRLLELQIESTAYSLVMGFLG